MTNLAEPPGRRSPAWETAAILLAIVAIWPALLNWQIDSLNLEVQHHARELAKKKINDSAVRRDTLYQIFNDSDIQTKLESGKLGEAKTAAETLIEEASQIQSIEDKGKK